ncbi:MAG TPA: clostripain-related cysteine peptidase [Herpetosiphonaceae bacterium]
MIPTFTHRRSRFHLCLALLVIAMVLGACGDEVAQTPTVPRRTPIPASAKTTPVPTRVPADAEDQTWLVMLYEDADDEILEEDMFNDLNEAELIGSSERVKIVAQMDRYDGGFDGDGDWTSTKRFLLEQDDDIDHLGSTELEDLGEVNMADADTLIDFVTWAVKEYPADKYALILSDHGAGWPGGWSDPEPATQGRHDIPMAESFGDMLFLMEMGEAMDHIMAETGIGQFELIGFDACLMSQLEVYSAMAPYARYAVASEEIEPTLGWAYAAFLGDLSENPAMDGAELSKSIVRSYIDQDHQIVDDKMRAKYIERMYDYDGTMSAKEIIAEESIGITLTGLDLSAVAQLNEALDNLVITLAKAEQKDVAKARRYAQAFETVFDEEQPAPYIDLGSFANLLKKKVDDPEVSKAADELLAAIDRAVVDEKHGKGKKGATGIAIHFPNSKLYKDETSGPESYQQIASRFAEESLWDDFLAYHYTGRELPERNAKPKPAPSADKVSSPGAQEIAVAPISFSADAVSPRKPVVISSEVSGDNLAFLYVFTGRLDEDENAIQIMDMDFLDAEQSREVDGIVYPDWGEGGNVAIEYEWDASVFAIDDGKKSEIAVLDPQDYGAEPEDATYAVEGLYTTAKGKKSRRAQLLFRDGELIQVLGFTSKEDTGAMREITPKSGDKFTILEQWISLDENVSEDEQIYTTEGATLTFGKDNFVWDEVRAPKGDYLVGFIAEDFDGNWYDAYETITVK